RRDARGRRHIFYDSHAPAEGGPVDLQQIKQHPLATEDWVEVGGQRWEIVSAPAEGFELAWRRARAPWVALGLGTTVSLLLMVLTAMYLRDYARTRAFADERAATAAELEQTNAQLQETNEEMEKFVSAVSHDLKNPLVGIQWLSRSARRAADQRDVQAMHRAVDGLDQAAQTMRRIIDDLLSHSRAGYAAFNEEQVDVDALVREILANHASEMERRGMHAQVDTSLPTIRGDRARLTAMFDNLIANAWKYGVPADSSRRPEVHIGCETTPTSNLQPPTIRFYVRDNGPGVPVADRESIFRRFYTNRPHEPLVPTGSRHSGLGLAIVRTILHGHSAPAEVRDRDDGRGGALFEIRLPCAD
ncbi:MAG: HAMP domain-containing sensor histidine kinase, partial [Phycisphaeraceae bacterium]